jgi:putative hydrolase of the HAD superfamily
VFIDDSAAVLASAQKYGIRYLLTLLQPDSQLAIRQVTDFPGFHHFDKLMPDILRDVE